MHWEVFAKVYDQSFAKKHPQLLCLILSDFKGLLDAELGLGTFSNFLEGQKKIKEYKELLPAFEFCDNYGFLLPKTSQNNKTYQEQLRLNILKASLAESGALTLRERVLDSNAREIIRERYGFLIDCMYPREIFEIYELCDSDGRFNCMKNKAITSFLRIMEVMLQGQVDKMELIERYYPDLYRVFLYQFHKIL